MNGQITASNIVMWIIGLLMIVTIGACDETDRRDQLEGKWLLKEKKLADGSFLPVDTVWYNFQNTLFQYQIYDKATDTYPYVYGFKNWEDDDHILLEMKPDRIPVENFIPSTDWNSGIRSFRVENVSGSRLVLSSDGMEYHFIKF